jgi:L-iditol 2-dehydrogenase
MKALVLKEYLKFEYTDVPMPEYGPEDVLLRVKAVSICGSDVHGYDGSSGRRQPPVIMGHEASGIIEAVGSEVAGFKPGDRVVFDSTIYCGKCKYCRKGKINLCSDRQVLGVSTGEYNRPGAFADFVAVPSRVLYHMPEGVTFEQATLVEPFAIAMHAFCISPVVIGDTVAVFGTGTIGLMIIQALKAAGCAEIIAVDIADHKLEVAKKLGATLLVNSAKQDVREAVLAITDGEGADVCFEAVGIGVTLNGAISACRKGGAVVMVGNIAKEVTFNLQAVVTREINMIGSCASAGEYDICLKLISRKMADVDALISVVAPLSDGQQWHDRLHAAEQGLVKVVLVP